MSDTTKLNDAQVAAIEERCAAIRLIASGVPTVSGLGSAQNALAAVEEIAAVIDQVRDLAAGKTPEHV